MMTEAKDEKNPDEKANEESTKDRKEKWALDDPRKPEDVLGLVKRTKIFVERMVDDMEVVEFVGIDCDGAAVLEAFPSVGVVAVIVGKEIVKTLELPLIGIIKSDGFQNSAVITSEQPSYPIRIYGDKRLVVFLCEMTTKFPHEAIPSIVNCIYDFAHRHKSPMVYSIEGIPKKEKITLPDGQEITLNLRQAGPAPPSTGAGAGGSDEEEPASSPDNSGHEGDEDAGIVIDDSLLAKMTKREESRHPKPAETPEGEKKEERAESKKIDAKKSPVKKAKGGKPAPKGKKKGKVGELTEDEEHDEEEDVESIANDLFGDKVHYVTTKYEIARQLRAAGHIPVVDGIIPGVTGGIVAQAPLTEQEVTVILVPSSIIFPDAEAAVKAIRVLTSLNPTLNLDKSIKLLEKEGEDLKKLMRQLLSGLDTSTLLRKSGSIPYGMYQ